MSYIHNPADGNIIYKWRVKKPNGKKVNAGYNAWSFAYGMSLAQKKISGTVNPQKRGVNWWLSKAVYNTTWSLFRPIYFFNNGEALTTVVKAMQKRFIATVICLKSIRAYTYRWCLHFLTAGFLKI
jgi:hypothetical protein